jgi:hypothetical protein
VSRKSAAVGMARDTKSLIGILALIAVPHVSANLLVGRAIVDMTGPPSEVNLMSRLFAEYNS